MLQLDGGSGGGADDGGVGRDEWEVSEFRGRLDTLSGRSDAAEQAEQAPAGERSWFGLG